MNWKVILIVVLVALTLFVIFNRKHIEAFSDFRSIQTDFTNKQSQFFELLDKAVPINKGLSLNPLTVNRAFQKLYVSPDKDYSQLLQQSDDLFADQDFKFCRNAVHPRNIQRAPRASIGCSWWFVEGDGLSTGALGTLDGPLDKKLSRDYPGGRWIWSLMDAGKMEDIKKCKKVKSCEVLDVPGIKGECGFCPDLGYAIPIHSDGSPKYDDEDNTCSSNVIISSDMCPRIELTAEDVITESEEITYDSNGNEIPRSTQSRVSRTVEIPRQLCDPDGRGNLSKDCLLSLAKSVGMSEGGQVAKILRNVSVIGELETYAMNVLKEIAQIPIPNEIFTTGSIERQSAAIVFKNIADLMRNDNKRVSSAAKYLSIGLNGYNICEFEDNDNGPFPTSCLQREFRKAGCQPSGTSAPTERNSAKYGNFKFGAVKREFSKLFDSMKNSKTQNEQNEAMMSCLGTELYKKRPDICDEPGIEYLFYTRKENGTPDIFIGRFISKNGLVGPGHRWYWEGPTAVRAIANLYPTLRKYYVIRTYATVPESTSMTIVGDIPTDSAQVLVNGTQQSRRYWWSRSSDNMSGTQWNFSIPPKTRNKIEIVNGGPTARLNQVGFPNIWNYANDNLDKFQLKQDSWRPVIALDFFRSSLTDFNDIIKLKPNSNTVLGDLGGKRCAMFLRRQGGIEFENGIFTGNFGTITMMYYANSSGNTKSLFIAENRTDNPSSLFFIGNPPGKVSFIHASYGSIGEQGTIRQGDCPNGMFEYGKYAGGFCCPAQPINYRADVKDFDNCPVNSANGRTLCALDATRSQGNPVCNTRGANVNVYWQARNENGENDMPINNPTGRWIHLSFVFYNNKKGVAVFENGVLIGNISSDKEYKSSLLNNCILGSELDGGIAWFHVYTNKLTPEEMKRDMNYDNPKYEMRDVPLEDIDLISNEYEVLPGKDYPGNDIVSMPSKSVKECASECYANKNCIAFQYNDSVKLCHLKNSIGPLTDSIPEANAGLMRNKEVFISAQRNRDYLVDVSGVSKNNFATVHMWNKWNGPNQKWTLTSDGLIKSVNSGKCLDVAAGATSNGTHLVQWDCHGGRNQRFTVDNQNRIHPEHAPEKCLDIHAPDFTNSRNGAKFQIWDCHNHSNQKWNISPVS